MNLEDLKKRLSNYKKEDIIITDHAEIQAYVRQIDLDEVKENVIHSERLVYAQEQKSKNENE